MDHYQIELTSFLADLEKADIQNDELFHSLLKRSEVALNLSDTEFAREFRVSRPTVTRWRTGANTPHSLMRKGVYRWMLNRGKTLQEKK